MTATVRPVTVRPVTVEHHRDPLGIGQDRPRLSWVVETGEPGWWQTGCEIEVTSATGTTTTGRVESTEQVLVPWPAGPLGSRERRSVRVRVWGPDAGPSAWSEPTALETGLLDPALWQARLVAPVLPPAGEDGEPAALLRGEVDVPAGVVRARLRATAHGVMTLHLNGSPVGDDVLHPGWTSYAHRLRYRTWDVTASLHPGRNALGVHLADGWFRGYLGFGGRRALYGDTTAVLVQLELDHADGTRTVVGTDAAWRCTLGPTTRADLLMGETFEAARDVPGWDRPGFDDSGWDPVVVQGFDPARLVAPDGPPVRRTQVVDPVEVLTTPSGRTVVDFGQNLVGRLRVDVPDGRGTITFRHAEVLEHGELGTRPLRRARATDEVVLDGRAFTWEPEFTVHGFRYAEVTGWPGEFDPAAVRAVVLHTDLRRTGGFTCSDPLLDRLHENVVWSTRGNFLDVPTDCPQRDERLGWTGDLMAFAPTAASLYDTGGMLTGWLADLRADQFADGNVPLWVPYKELDDAFPDVGAEAGWGDAATVVPWTLHERHADAGLLARQWDSMTGWVDAFTARAGADLDFPAGGIGLGDWLDAAAPDDQPWAARLPWQAVATAYLAQSARILRDAAAVLGREPDGARYADLFNRAAARFRSEYVTPTGRSAFASQTACALGLRFGLLTSDQVAHAGDLLAAQVAADGFRIGSGFLGTPHVCDALADSGHAGTAWKLLLQRECPSWLYAVTMGATTVWERWNSMLPDGSINPGEMTSFNHYALGAVADFLHRRVAGLAAAAPGYRELRVAPLPHPDLTWARAWHETPYGRAEVSWTLAGEEFTLDVTVPPSTTAEVHLPDGSAPTAVASGGHRFTCRFTPLPD
ncbi:glycoside hydrolase family 78 protein [Kineococcus rhizosphaerae]|uniref:alpha-L-rhamnosidase n=1 Tax=Kineococcus rhizosphaerae TaxID=559628 RepID=A0A2T0RB41_9ACTN|nr:glycoside hydrolase family 78 protein [Kineococcus rhizosphaerae]PRY18373.1 alpha-L-rhamnosidase [Kineococcus rhizosphaerae]